MVAWRRWRLGVTAALVLAAAAAARADKIAYQGQFDAGGRRVLVMTESGKSPVVLPNPPGVAGDMITPALSREGQRVAFAAKSGGNYKLFVWEIGKDNKPVGAPRPLTSGEGNDEQPTWSLDGQRVAFVRSEGNAYGLYVLDLAPEAKPVKVAVLSVNFRNACPDWSPDGARLVYNMDEDLWVAASDGSGAQQLRTDGYYPSWSPEGKYIAFFAKKPAPALMKMNTDSGQASKLVGGVEGFGETAWSPWGSRIAFKASKVGGKPGVLWVVEADGTKVRPLQAKGVAHAYLSWSAEPAAVTAGPPPPPVVAAPQGPIAILSPEDSKLVRGKVEVVAAKKAAGGYVALLVDDSFEEARIEPYRFTWDARYLGDGPHTLTAIAFDEDTQQEGQQTITVQVRNSLEATAIPAQGVPLAMRFKQEAWSYQVSATGRAGEPGEVLLPENQALVGELRATFTDIVDEATNGGQNAVVTARANMATLSRPSGPERLPEVARPLRLKMDARGTVTPESLGGERFAPFELHTELPTFPVKIGDTWSSNLVVMADLAKRQPVQVLANHTVDGFQWEGEQEAVRIKSSYALPSLELPGTGITLSNVQGQRTTYFAYKTMKLLRVEDQLSADLRQEMPAGTLTPGAPGAPGVGAPVAISRFNLSFGGGRNRGQDQPAPPPEAIPAAPAPPQEPPTPQVRYTFGLQMVRI